MFRGTWLIVGLILIMIISTYFFRDKNKIQPWMKCKESLFSQIVFNQCTPSIFVVPRLDDEIKNEEKPPFEEPNK